MVQFGMSKFIFIFSFMLGCSCSVSDQLETKDCTIHQIEEDRIQLVISEYMKDLTGGDLYRDPYIKLVERKGNNLKYFVDVNAEVEKKYELMDSDYLLYIDACKMQVEKHLGH